MLMRKRTTFQQIIIFIMLLLGIALVGISAFYASAFLAILGVTIIFWDAIFLYVTPSKHVPLTLLNVSAEAGTINLERVILELNLGEKGIYLPPQKLKNIESSLVFIPETFKTSLPIETSTEKLFGSEKTGVFITPPGAALLHLFEEELGFSFTKIDFNQFQNTLPKLLVDDLELAEIVEIQNRDYLVVLEITGSIFDEICRQTDSQPKTHKQVGCLLSSAIACALAKVTGNSVIIQSENRNQETKTTRIEYQIQKKV